MKKPIAILGGGGHGRVVLDALRLAGFEFLGIIDAKPDFMPPQGLRHLGGDLDAVSPADCDLVLGIGSVDVGAQNPRPRLFAEAKARGFHLPAFVHPAAFVAGDVILGEGAQILAGAIVQVGSRVGSNVIVNTRASVDHDGIIGDHVHLAPGVVLSGNVEIGAGSHLGTGAIVIQGMKIGVESMIRAGSVITKSVSAGGRV
ncbi:acetyltransferase [Dongia sp.]|uniref:acetyltransferase n=1 Tax=Dongia sp. TaxID=1977262 RepID=UPI0035B1D948